jgi:two-component system sensor histidine kinase CpxA
MKSIYARILLWCFGTLLLSLAAFSIVTRYVETHAMASGGPFARFDALVMNDGIEAYESGGASGLQRYLQKAVSLTGIQRYLTDAAGNDLATGADRSNMLIARPPALALWAAPWRPPGRIVMAVPSPDNRYRLISIVDPPFAVSSLLAYYLLILAAVALVCWALALNLALPLRDLARGVERVGGGDLSVPLNSRRRDELGDLANSFDRMAERIGTLLTAERRLLQDVSHELRSPLARMKFAAELARKPEHRDEAIGRLKTDINRLGKLISSLLEVTRAEGDPLARKEEVFKIGDFLREIAADCLIEAEARHCRVEVAAPLDQTIRGDHELLRRAFENIVRNAILYAPEGSVIEVRAEASAQTALVSVRDYGEGVPEELLDKLFDPFFRVDDSRESSTGGVGLGLAIARRSIHLHGGTIEAANALPGLRVSVEVPVCGAGQGADVEFQSRGQDF